MEAENRTAENGRPSLRVASYNVHRCVGMDGSHDPDRIAEVITELDVDAVGLQEVDSRYHIESGIDQIEYLARRTGLHAVPGPTLFRHDASYGNALLTRHPVRSVRQVDISVGTRREARGALDVLLDAGGRPLRFIVTHFGLGPWERRRQASTLLRLLDVHVQPLTVLCGDFNEWVPRWATLMKLDARLGGSHPIRTFPSRWPALALDRIWIHPHQAAAAVWAHRSDIARVASDHLPVCASIEFPAHPPADG